MKIISFYTTLRKRKGGRCQHATVTDYLVLSIEECKEGKKKTMTLPSQVGVACEE